MLYIVAPEITLLDEAVFREMKAPVVAAAETLRPSAQRRAALGATAAKR